MDLQISFNHILINKLKSVVNLLSVIDGAATLIPPIADKTVKPNEIIFISYIHVWQGQFLNL